MNKGFSIRTCIAFLVPQIECVYFLQVWLRNSTDEPCMPHLKFQIYPLHFLPFSLAVTINIPYTVFNFSCLLSVSPLFKYKIHESLFFSLLVVSPVPKTLSDTAITQYMLLLRESWYSEEKQALLIAYGVRCWIHDLQRFSFGTRDQAWSLKTFCVAEFY